MPEVQIVNFHPRHATAFKQLNIDWMSRLWEIDAQDLQLLDNPQAHVIDRGGAVFIALLDGDPVGTCCLLKVDGHGFELAKMCVASGAQGQGIGERLAKHAISIATNRGAQLIYLRTASNLTAAITLYRKLGFVQPQCIARESTRCDVEMELRL